MKEQLLFEREYTSESIFDLDRDVSEILEYSDIPDEFEGLIKVTITYVSE